MIRNLLFTAVGAFCFYVLCRLLVLALTTNHIYPTKGKIERELEKFLEIDIPSEFTLLDWWDGGFTFSNHRYAYEIQFDERSFKIFQENWGNKYGGSSWSGVNSKNTVYLHVLVRPEQRVLFYDYGTTSRGLPIY